MNHIMAQLPDSRLLFILLPGVDKYGNDASGVPEYSMGNAFADISCKTNGNQRGETDEAMNLRSV